MFFRLKLNYQKRKLFNHFYFDAVEETSLTAYDNSVALFKPVGGDLNHIVITSSHGNRDSDCFAIFFNEEVPVVGALHLQNGN